jgi:cytochrome c5
VPDDIVIRPASGTGGMEASMNYDGERISAGSAVAVSCVAALAIVGVVLSLAADSARAQGRERSGQQVVESVCVSCHGTGANGAPKIGDSKAWAERASRGLTALSESAINGIRNMPPHGGAPALTNLEIERAITYMVNASGGHWAESIDRTGQPADRSGRQVVEAYCYKCHETSVGGAPGIGDRAAWIPRAKQGFDVLVRSAINGHGGMPPRGGVANLTDAEIRSAIAYMLNPTVAAVSPPALETDRNHRFVAGTEIYFGVTSAESLRKQHPGTDLESAMHGEIPSGADFYHVNVSLFDSTTRAAIADAQVEVRLPDPIRGDQVSTLQPMVVNNVVSYGNYVRLPGKNAQTIVVVIRRPGLARAIETKFDVQK